MLFALPSRTLMEGFDGQVNAVQPGSMNYIYLSLGYDMQLVTDCCLHTRDLSSETLARTVCCYMNASVPKIVLCDGVGNVEVDFSLLSFDRCHLQHGMCVRSRWKILRA
jgi:hypothetical protein